MTDVARTGPGAVGSHGATTAAKNLQPSEGGDAAEHNDALVNALTELSAAIRDLVARSAVSPEELLTVEQLGDLFRMSPRTLRDLASTGQVPHRRIGKHYRFSREDIAEICEMAKQPVRGRTRPLRLA